MYGAMSDSMEAKEKQSNNTLFVHSTESGQKLLQFLVRRLGLSTSILHKWIRTGQIRVQGGRSDAFRRLQEGEAVRLPPFALSMAHSASILSTGMHCENIDSSTSATELEALPPPIYKDAHLLVFNKPAGLPVHTGTGHSDSLATRLEHEYATDIFRPTPIHRLDKDTSGIILVARSYTMLRTVQDILKTRTLTKEYLAWVHGLWPHEGVETELQHFIQKKYHGDDERVRVLSADEGKHATCTVSCLRRYTAQERGISGGISLMRVRLISGRTHQIRVQLGSEGFPVVGDIKYGAPFLNNENPLCLHAFRVTLPKEASIQSLQLQEHSFSALPPWSGRLAVGDVLTDL